MEVLEKLLKLPDKSTYYGKRDYALICLPINTAIRPGDAQEKTSPVRRSIGQNKRVR